MTTPNSPTPMPDVISAAQLFNKLVDVMNPWINSLITRQELHKQSLELINNYELTIRQAEQNKLKSITELWLNGEKLLTAYLPTIEKYENKIKELVEALLIILPMAKGYAAENRVGSNDRYIEIASKALTNFDSAPTQHPAGEEA